MEMFNLNEERLIRAHEILELVAEDIIYERYYPFQFKIGRKIKSPFHGDNTPSFNFYVHNSKIYWKDFGGDGGHGNVFEFVMRSERCDYQEALRKINDAFGLKLGLGPPEPSSPRFPSRFTAKELKEKEKTDIKVEVKAFTWADLEFWNTWNIGLPILKMYNVGAANRVFLWDDIWANYTENCPVYYYYFPRSDSFKLYRPKTKNLKRKFLSNTVGELDIQGWDQCGFQYRDRIPLLVLTKAMKEVMFYRAFGIDAIAPHGENHKLQDSELLKSVLARCDRVVSVYDNDKSGLEGAMRIYKELEIPSLTIPRHWGGPEKKNKNITDLWEYSPNDCYEFLQTLKNIR